MMKRTPRVRPDVVKATLIVLLMFSAGGKLHASSCVAPASPAKCTALKPNQNCAIEVGPGGAMPKLAFVQPGSCINWKLVGGARTFAVEFDQGSPFEADKYDDQNTYTHTGAQDKVAGHYIYHYVLKIDGTQVDPHVIIIGGTRKHKGEKHEKKEEHQ